MLNLGELHKQIRALDKSDGTLRRQAFHSLKHHEEQEWDSAPLEVIDSLVESLQQQLASSTDQPFIRQEAATILGNIGPRSEAAIPQLIDLLQEEIPHGIREAAVIALGKIGKKARTAVAELIRLLSSSRAALVLQAVRALGNIGCADQRVHTALVNLWLTPQASAIQAQVAIALCKLKIDATGLRRFLTSTLAANQEVALRTAAAEALAWCSKAEVDVVPALLTATLNDKNEQVRQAAEASLSQLRLSRAKAIDLCCKQLGESLYAETALRKSGQLAVPCLIPALAAAESAIREKAARILGGLGELAAEAVPDLTSLLHDKDLDVRLAAAKSLWSIAKKPDLVVPVLVDLIGEKWQTAPDAGESRRRFLQTVIEALRRIGPPAKAAIPALTVKTRDPNRVVSECAVNALKEIAQDPRQ